MARVHHRVGVRADLARVFSCLIEPQHLTGWWASSCERDDRLRLGFAGLTTLVFDVAECNPPERLLLRCEGEPELWRGSSLTFDVAPGEGQTFLYLTHEKKPASDNDFLYFNTKWPLFLVSLKDYLETGSGRPFPHDQRIEHS